MTFSKILTYSLTIGILSITATTLFAQRVEKRIDQSWDFKIADKPVEKVKLPHTWNAVDAADGGGEANSSVDATSYLRAPGTYTTFLEVKKEDTKRYFLNFEGSSIVTIVSVNGQRIGRHEGAFGAFTFEITDALKSGNNQIEVIADNTFNINIPPISGDFSIFGGLYRHVNLIETPKDCISPLYNGTNGVLITQTKLDDQEGILTVKAYHDHKTQTPSKINFSILNANGHIITQQSMTVPHSSETLFNAITMPLTVPNPIRWNGLENPYLYTVKVDLMQGDKVIDTITDQWGFRTLEITRDSGFVLNGTPMRLHGVNRHQDREHVGTAQSDTQQLEDMALIKEIGANTVRLAHYIHAPIVYKQCDRLGIIVYAEAPIIDRTNNTKAFTNNALQQLKELIYQNQNRCSIAVWSLSNELGNGPNGRASKGEFELMQAMYDLAKEIDPTRPRVIAANGFRAANEIADHVAFNTYPGWYGGNFYFLTGDIKAWRAKYKNKSIAVSEYGAGGGPNTHEFPVNRSHTIHPFHPEEYQSICHEQQWRSIKNAEVWGSYVWNMFDFGADQRTEGEHEGRNDKGLVSYDRKTRKDAFYFYKANWSKEPMVHITSKRFSERKPGLMPVKVYSNCDEVSLYMGNHFVGTSKGDDCGVFTFDNVCFDKGERTLKAVGKKDNVTVEDISIVNINNNNNNKIGS